MRSATVGKSDCYDELVLRDFTLGKLVDPMLEEQIADHVGSCAFCESRLDSFNNSQDPILGLLRHRSPTAASPASPSAARVAADISLDATRSNRQGQGESTESAGVGSVPRDSELPLRIDQYFVIRLLGSGGFGQVYLAKDPAHDRLVAIKVPHPFITESQKRRDQFLREARTVAALNHPHIVPVYDCRELPDGRCIVVMKFIEGRTLADLMRSGPLDQRRAAEIVATIAEALHFAHQRAIWHRDVKPANVLLDGDGRLYLTDFGLAVHASQQHLLEGELAGTYPYMSPEQIRGESHQLDARSDVWSLGVILYEMLTRQRPFRGAGREQYQDCVQHQSPRRPRDCDPRIGRALESACLRCLNKSPKDRFATAAELARALRHTSRRRHRSALLAIATIIGLAVLGVAASRGLFELTPKEPEVIPAVAESNVIPFRPLAWSTFDPLDHFGREADTGRIAVRASASFTCFETNRPLSDQFELETSADFPYDHGIGGFALGIHETGAKPPKSRCVIVYVSSEFPSQGTEVAVEICELGKNEIGQLDFVHRRHVIGFDVDEKSITHFRLSVKVENERITELRFNDRILPEAEDALRDVKIATNATCGVVASTNVVFHSLICKDKRL